VIHDRAEEGTRAAVTPRLVGVVWVLLLINTIGFTNNVNAVISFPQWLAQLITMGALITAFALALVLNARVQVRPDAFLLVLTLLLIASGASALTLEAGFGGVFRLARFAIFIAVLWLVSRWWGADLRPVWSMMKLFIAILGIVLAGLAISPSDAMWGDNARLVGILWPMPAPRVGQIGAVLTGLLVILRLNRLISSRAIAGAGLLAVGCLMLSHTRTAVLALIVALVVALVPLLATSATVRQAVGTSVIVAVIAASFFAPALMEWFQRGQSAEELGSLTGRQLVWDALLSEPRSGFHTLFGNGLGDKSYHGSPIDNSWFVVYLEQGIIGTLLVVAMVLVLCVAIVLRRPTPATSCGAFLVVFCLMSSYTEVGLGDASLYLVYLAMGASLLKPGMSRSPAQRPVVRMAA
jgi:hypothetical protein